MEIKICKVDSVKDDNGADRVTVILRDMKVGRNKKRQAFPLLPKTIHVKPKKDEMVMVFDDGGGQLYYIGPIIPQPQYMEKSGEVIAGTGLDIGFGKMLTSPSNIPEANGAIADDDEIAIYGRKNSDIILSDNDVRVRAGARLTNFGDVKFNKKDPAFLRLQYFDVPINTDYIDPLTKQVVQKKNVKSAATISAQEINLISCNGDPYVNTTNADGKGISDEDMKKLIEKAHELPYGDKLVEFLDLFVNTFLCHTHPYPNMTPCPTKEVLDLSGYDLQSLLSKNVRIN